MIDAVQMAGIKARMALEKHPQLKEQVDDAWALMIDEIGNGESEDNETELFLSWLALAIYEEEA